MGSFSSKIISICIIIIFFAPAYSQQYAVNVYDDQSSGFPKRIKTVFVDLAGKRIVGSVVIGEQGQILNKIPLPLNIDKHVILATAAIEGCYCDNSVVGQVKTRFSFIDPVSFEINNSFADDSLLINEFGQIDSNSIHLSGIYLGEDNQSISGTFRLDKSYKIDIVNPLKVEHAIEKGINIDNFTYLEPVDRQANTFISYSTESRYVLKTDDSFTAIIDSLKLTDRPHRSIIVAVLESIMYVFHQNYEIHTKFTTKNRNDDRIGSHVILYDLSDFSVLDSIPLNEYSVDNYINDEFDRADVVGNYIVYYFFGREGLTKYAPAMLFIFDTRTNESSWLRVGWR